MSDSAGGTGGLVAGYTIVEGFSNCTVVSSNATSPVTLDIPTLDACDEFDVTIEGGQAPYMIDVLIGQYGTQRNTTSEDATVRIRNSIAAGQTFNVFATDSLGQSSIVSPPLTSRLYTACAAPANDRKFPVGAIAGIVVGVVLLFAIAAFFIYRYVKRRRGWKEAAARADPPVTTEYRLSTGGTPLITPFVVPPISRPTSLHSIDPSSAPSEQGSASTYSNSAYGGEGGTGFFSNDGVGNPRKVPFQSMAPPPSYQGMGSDTETLRKESSWGSSRSSRS